jgi:hypothetical protein
VIQVLLNDSEEQQRKKPYKGNRPREFKFINERHHAQRLAAQLCQICCATGAVTDRHLHSHRILSLSAIGDSQYARHVRWSRYDLLDRYV